MKNFLSEEMYLNFEYLTKIDGKLKNYLSIDLKFIIGVQTLKSENKFDILQQSHM
jgi:hypothetical protein